MKPIVAVSQRVAVDQVTGERRDCLDQRWSPFLAACGLLCLPIPNHGPTALTLLSLADPVGILLTGGNDLAAYGGDAPERDETEAALVHWASANRRPVMGVCRGAQHLIHLRGGRLQRVDGHVRTAHELAPGGRSVMSYHNFAPAEPLPGLQVLARSRDGQVEAFGDGGGVMGIMWHPEREDAPHADDIACFKTFWGIDP